jgi:hypothetical protein
MGTRWTRLGAAVALGAALAAAAAWPASSVAEPTPTPAPSTIAGIGSCKITITVTANPNGTYTVGGVLTGAANSAVTGATVNVTAGDVKGSATTDAQGGYGVSLTITKPGEYTFEASTPAGPLCYQGASASQKATVVSPVQLTVTADATTIVPGGPIGVSGRLTTQDTGVDSAYLTLTTTFDTTPRPLTTDSDGRFSTVITGPETGGTSFTVTITFPGDGYLPGTSQQVSVLVLDAPTSTPTPTVKPTTATTSATSAEPVDTGGPEESQAVVPMPWQTGSRLFVVLLVFIIVAALATGTLLIIAVVSRQRRGLAADERRGFGSDFGKGSDDDGLSGWFGADPYDDQPGGR